MSSNKPTSLISWSSHLKKAFTHVLYCIHFNLSSGNLEGGWAFSFVINFILKTKPFPSKTMVENI